MLIPMPIPTPPPHFQARMDGLEHGLLVALETLQTMIDRLETKLGDDLFTNPAKSPAILRSEKEAEETVDRFDQLIKQGQQSTVVRELRTEFSITWDQAQAAYNEWNTVSRQHKVRRLRLSRWLIAAGVTDTSK